ncbi:MAG: hypothetical protein NT165_00615 [Candidatus Falkowbacteria bacterium]|nr:hypothetical protein [Candidatus Falkowbacteria bacterium]
MNRNEIPVFNEREGKLEADRREMINSLANLMHESWRQGRFDAENNIYEPRVKATADEDWVSAHNGAREVDIANTSFSELPADWQEENYLSAKVATEKLEEVLYLIHDKWLDRNDNYASSEQKTQYSRLPNDEKLKDLDILKEAIDLMEGKLKIG